MDSNFGNDFLFNAFPFMFVVIFVIVIGGILFAMIKGALLWSKNNQSPVLAVSATVVAKRTDINRHSHESSSGMDHSSYTTHYHATFQVESGDRMELAVNDTEYGMLAEGDTGKLTFQGTRYKEFVRNI